MHYLLRFTIFELIAIIILFDWTRDNRGMNYDDMGVDCSLIHFEDFHSQSFVPNGLHISYGIENGVGINYNITALQSFPGKILVNLFIRRLSQNPGEKSVDVGKYKNLDFCKIIEMAQNFSLTTQNATLLQSTFITSCPLIRGFYYIKNGTIRTQSIPPIFVRGIYWLQMELVQVFGEVTKLMNIKAKCNYAPTPDDILDIFHVLKQIPED